MNFILKNASSAINVAGSHTKYLKIGDKKISYLVLYYYYYYMNYFV